VNHQKKVVPLTTDDDKNVCIFSNEEKCIIQQQHDSTIYPATSSPSASGKSKGILAVSARC
jgi:hypothetical protein